jgi:formate dehydrogenase major subunit
MWVPLRAGTDILLFGALIRYVLENERYFKEYVLRYTNASTILREDYRDSEDGAGLFSGWDAEKKMYDPETWLYEGSTPKDSGALGSSSGRRRPCQGSRGRGGQHASVCNG